MLEAVRFRNYVFPQNPYRITVHLLESVQNPGQWKIRALCRGRFSGQSYSEVLAQLAEFRQCTADGARGILLLPGMHPFLAYLSDFAFDAEADGKVIPYTMTFTEVWEGEVEG